MPRLGIEPSTFRSWDEDTTNWATPARTRFSEFWRKYYLRNMMALSTQNVFITPIGSLCHFLANLPYRAPRYLSFCYYKSSSSLEFPVNGIIYVYCPVICKSVLYFSHLLSIPFINIFYSYCFTTKIKRRGKSIFILFLILGREACSISLIVKLAVSF